MNTERLSAALADRYRIERHLGEGGMSTVFLCADLRHDRRVALKVLRPELAAVIGGERFVSEIRTTAGLQHPHIVPLFDSGSAGGFLYYVMPFIEGETLREKLSRETQLGVEESVRIARDVADALDYAHRHGVIHRDIKPENILLHDQRPMVADFGIALAVSAAAGGRMTETGLSLGTPHYMSPEQATAEKEITARSDVYSLGSVLYEMLTGNPPHTGASAQQIIMKIIAEPVEPVSTLRRSVPPNVAAAVATSLEKLPADRFASAKAFGEALGSPSYARAGAVPVRGDRGGPAGEDWRVKVAVPGLVLAGILLLVVAWGATRHGPAARVSRFEVSWPGGRAGDRASLAVSPDGSHIVYVRRDERGDRLVARRRDQLEEVEVPGTESAYNPAFSPDGKRVAFMTGGTIRTVDLTGGPVTIVTDSRVGVPGVAWGPDDYIYFDGRGIGPLLRVRATGGAVEAVSTLDTTSKEAQHVWPDVLPNGRGVIMTVNRGGPGTGPLETDGIAVLDLRTGRHRELFRGVVGRYATSGHLLYVTTDGVLRGAPFDQGRLEATGPPVTLATGLSVQASGAGAVDLVISRDGTLWYATGGQTAELRELVWVARDGKLSPFDPEVVGRILDAALSPDSTRVAFIVRGDDGAGHVWTRQLGNANSVRLTFDRSYNGVAWRHDGRGVIATASPGDLFTIAADGGALPVQVGGISRNVTDARWSPNGEWIVYSTPGSPTLDINAIRPGVDSVPRPLVATSSSEAYPSVSPDGRWLLFQSARLATVFDVLVRPFPNTSGSVSQVSSSGGSQPEWSRDGREIFYRNRDDALVTVPVLSATPFAVGAERVLFSLRGVSSWDVAAGGRRFLLVREREAPAPRRLVVVENFFEELKDRVPR